MVTEQDSPSQHRRPTPAAAAAPVRAHTRIATGVLAPEPGPQDRWHPAPHRARGPHPRGGKLSPSAHRPPGGGPQRAVRLQGARVVTTSSRDPLPESTRPGVC